MSKLTAEQVAELRAKATPGKWVCGYKFVCVQTGADTYHNIARFPGRGCASENHQWIRDAELIAALPDICELVATQTVELAALKASEARLIEFMTLTDSNVGIAKGWQRMEAELAASRAECERLKGELQALRDEITWGGE